MPLFTQTVSGVCSNELRLDRYIAENLGLLSRSQIKARQLTALVNGKEVKISRLIKDGDVIELSWNEAQPQHIIPENIPLDIIFEDAATVIINKAQGMVVHPGAGNWRGTLANALYYRRLEQGDPCCGEGLRPGIVHRLDKETSGVMVAAYNDEALAYLAGQFKSRKVRKIYLAIVGGIPRESRGRIETCIARDPRDRKRFTASAKGKYALTLYRVIKTWKNHSLIMLRPKTGRTHQIRVHLRYLGHPIVGDSLYGFTDTAFPDARLMLHSKSLTITLPGEQQARKFKAVLPKRFIRMIHCLNTEG